jgi:hypothetical protein
MGLTFSTQSKENSIIPTIADQFVDVLQKKGLAPYTSSVGGVEGKIPGRRICHWQKEDIFGSKGSRKQSYAALMAIIQPLIKQGYDKAGIDLKSSTHSIEKNIAINLSNFVIKCLKKISKR